MNTLPLCDKTGRSFYDKFACFMGLEAALEKYHSLLPFLREENTFVQN